MKRLSLKYGSNPHQKPAEVWLEDGGELPFDILNGAPGYINLLDALNSWQLVSQLRQATGLPAAASFKHVSPAGAAVGLPMEERLRKACFVDDVEGLNDSPLACAYARARGADRLCSFGDWIALSDPCDLVTARVIAREVSDGVIAPGYQPEALSLLKSKRKGGYAVLRMDPGYRPPLEEKRQVFGVTLSQRVNDAVIDDGTLGRVVTRRRELNEDARRDLKLSLITLKYTQSNSVCFAYGGQAIGVGAGQQSRVHCTRLAAGKADLWHLRQHDKALALRFLPELGRAQRDNAVDLYLSDRAEQALAGEGWRALFEQRPAPFPREEQQAWLRGLSGVSLGSDAFFPFEDSILRARDSGVSYVAQPGGSVRDQEVIDACDRLDMVMALTGLRLFHH